MRFKRLQVAGWGGGVFLPSRTPPFKFLSPSGKWTASPPPIRCLRTCFCLAARRFCSPTAPLSVPMRDRRPPPPLHPADLAGSVPEDFCRVPQPERRILIFPPVRFFERCNFLVASRTRGSGLVSGRVEFDSPPLFLLGFPRFVIGACNIFPSGLTGLIPPLARSRSSVLTDIRRGYPDAADPFFPMRWRRRRCSLLFFFLIILRCGGKGRHVSFTT